ncbi:hypothetical protein OG21DRAFT_1512578 [Imleria badia]|nr:hypothetical protein OG21DRAFT_1512578 [Imleria badia]
MPSSGAAAQSDPAQVIEDPPRRNDSGVPLAPLDTLRVNDLPDDSNPVQREPTDTLGEELDKSLAYLLNLLDTPREQNNDRPPSPFEREATEPLEQDDDQRLASLLDLADPASLPTPRPPTPPPSRRPSKLTRHNFRLAPSTKTDHAELPVAQASVQAGKGAQLHPHQGAAWTPRPSPSRARVAGDEDDEEVGRGGSAWGVGRRTALGLVSRTPPTTRARKQKGEEEARRVRTKRTRFVEDKGEKDGATSPAVRVRRTGSNDDSKRAGGPGPLRSILRNKHAMPYDKTMVRHAGRRRASVP